MNGWPSSPFHEGKRLRFGCLGQVWNFGPLQKMFAPPVCLGASQFFYACCNINAVRIQTKTKNCDRTNFWLTKIEVRANKSEISNAAILTTTMLEAPSMTKKCM